LVARDRNSGAVYSSLMDLRSEGGGGLLLARLVSKNLTKACLFFYCAYDSIIRRRVKQRANALAVNCCVYGETMFSKYPNA